MVRLTSETERRDSLVILEADRREIAVQIVTEQILRKGTSRRQRRVMRDLRPEARRQINAQLNAESRAAFRGSIAVKFELQSPSLGVGLAPSIKEYLDLLVGAVVPDDASVDHLMVLRSVAGGKNTVMKVLCQPISVFVAEFDRAFRVAPESSVEEPEGSQLPWGLRGFDQSDQEMLAYEESILNLLNDLDAQAEEQLKEDPDADVILDLTDSFRELGDPDVRASVRANLESSTGYYRGRLFTDQAFDVRDRPGLPPTWLEEAEMMDGTEIVSLGDAGPGCLILPPPPRAKRAPGEPKWQDVVKRELMGRRLDGWRTARFAAPLALDIALRGDAGATSDIDNVAHQLLSGFQQAFEDAQPEISGYRVYRMPAVTDDVRVRVLPHIRLERLAGWISEAREIVRSERVSRAKST